MFNVEIDDLAEKVYFNEFVTNVLLDDIGIVTFDIRGHGGCQKAPLGRQKRHERVDLETDSQNLRMG